MKYLVLGLILFSNLVLASTEKELIDLMSKNFEDKEITVNRSLCNEFNSLYDKLSSEEKKEYSRKDCGRVEVKVDESKITDAYFSKLNSQINIIADTKKEISDYEVKIIVDSMMNK